MASLNKVFIMGNLTRDPEVRYVPSGTAVCNFSIAISRKYKTKEGESKEDVVFVNNITAWARLAEICGEYLQKGAPVHVEGRLTVNTWEDKETGKKRSQLRITAEKIQMLGRKGDRQQAEPGDPDEQAAQGASEKPAPKDDEDLEQPPF